MNRMQTPEFQQMVSNPQMMQQMLQMQQMMGKFLIAF